MTQARAATRTRAVTRTRAATRTRTPARVERVERGDWQTPPALARAVLERLAACGVGSPRTVIEPTCGEGVFLVEAARRFPRAALIGFEIDGRYASAARAALGAERARARVARVARVTQADFFEVAWEDEIAQARGPLLVVGNPPWVTSAQLGVLGSTNLPVKQNAGRLRGLDALTGKSNFDVSEWMILRLLEALAGRDATLAMLCKSAVARRIIETAARRSLDLSAVGLWRIDAAQHFAASVSAVLLVGETRRARRRLAPTASRPGAGAWPVHADLDAPTGRAPEAVLGVVDAVLVADADRFARTRHLAGDSDPEWRSGVKHDCARVMELERAPDGSDRWLNGLGEHVDIEEALLHPLLKSADIAHQRAASSRAMIVTQRALGEDTAALQRTAPRAWTYLSRHRALLDARKSTIYERQPPFAIFGVGPYSFAPWKVAVSGLYKRATFTVVGPHLGRPVILDDTCYFLGFDDEPRARRAADALRSAAATEFLEARIFWDAKRPITKATLQTLDLAALLRATQPT